MSDFVESLHEDREQQSVGQWDATVTTVGMLDVLRAARHGSQEKGRGLTVTVEVALAAKDADAALILVRMMEQAVRTLADADHHAQTGLVRR